MNPPPLPSMQGGYVRGLYRDGNQLFAAGEPEFPDRCIICNGHAPKRMRTTLSWHPAWVTFTILIGVVFYFIFSIFLSKRATLNLPICEHHMSARRRSFLYVLAVFLAAIAAIWIGGAIQRTPLMALGSILLVTALIVGLWLLRLAKPTMIDNYRNVRLKNISKEFLAELPELRR